MSTPPIVTVPASPSSSMPEPIAPLADDPFGYLERGDDARTIAWTAEQNSRARAYVLDVPFRAALADRFEALSAFGALGTPVARGTKTFYVARRGRAEQAALFVRDASGERALVDVAGLDQSGLTALDWWYPSPQGKYVAYGLSRNGDEKSVLHVRRTDGLDLSEAIDGTRHCSLAWWPDERGFFYTRFPNGGPYEQRLYRHELGDDLERDALLFGAERPVEDYLEITASANGRWLAVTANEGWRRNDLFVAELSGAAIAFTAVAVGNDARYSAEFDGDRMIVRTNDGAPNYRVVEIDATRAERSHWREIVAERDHALERCAVARGALVLCYLENVRSVAYAIVREDAAQTFVDAKSPVPIEPLGATIVDLSCDEDSSDAFVVDVDFFTPPTARRIRLAHGDVRVEPYDLEVAEEGARALVDADLYRSVQEWFVSKDGTRVPMFVLSKRDLPRDGTAPAVLYGYGGFDITLSPAFQPYLLPWLDAGGVFAIANLRGGGEFGEAWHRAGMREKKQNVFDDFIAAADFLRESGIVDPTRLAISGGSNGGLLVAVAMTQRPDLFAAVHCAVPLCDMLRYHHFLLARLWIPEYGDPDDPADAEFLRAYSPYHNVRDGEPYPATYFVTAESDTRVDPMHARKMAARVAAANSGAAPILCYVESNAGHGVGKPRAKVVDELVDRWSFFAKTLGVALE